ncbi:hypothetical protein LZ683_14585 [Comamonas testosteroni]|uniref:hypothetical protein n=1 Tax=Comamonas testosteroni TaxID=285 RepID=UPI0023AAE1C4|nr:hypothetical protein [Comamonas testosteroni]WEE75413.1 hypothetical protein LZ683_14585 [Comamonas testosteroni]
MSTKHLLITEITPKEGRSQAIAREWSRLPMPQGVVERAVFLALDGSTVLELSALSSLDCVESLALSWDQVWIRLGADLASDFRRQLLTFVEAPKDTPQALPTTPYLQLRHVEVPPGRFGEYRAWRERTIFDVVRKSPAVEQFSAYHSLISSEPGVMFLSGFSVEPDAYAATFSSPRYQQIVQEAGDNFITGGERGLYTKSYLRVAS